MAKPTTTEEAVDAAALGPRRVRVGNDEVEQHPIPDLIKADDRAKSATAGNRNHLGLRFSQIIPPGAG